MADNEMSHDAPYIGEPVIGSACKYHRRSCHLIRNISTTNRKRLRNWEEAVFLGLTPCGVCKPFCMPAEPPRRPIGFHA